jgi:predicted permease
VQGQAPALRELFLAMLKNPFIVATLSAVLWQLLGLPAPALGLQVLDIVGRGALGLALLAVGAGLRIEDALSSKAPVLAATFLKLLVMPLLMVGFLKLFGVSGTAFGVAALCGAVPTGSGAYVLARQMGGDAGLVANILTLQVIFAVVTIPLILGWFA